MVLNLYPGKWRVFHLAPDLCLVDGGQAMGGESGGELVATGFPASELLL